MTEAGNWWARLFLPVFCVCFFPRIEMQVVSFLFWLLIFPKILRDCSHSLLAFSEAGTKHCSKPFLSSDPVFYRGRNWGTERFNGVPRATQQGSSRARWLHCTALPLPYFIIPQHADVIYGVKMLGRNLVVVGFVGNPSRFNLWLNGWGHEAYIPSAC